MTTTNNQWVGWVAVLGFITFAFIFPRFLLTIWGPENPWTNYFYLYGFGVIYSGSGVLLALKTGACNWERPRDRYWMKVVMGGFLWFAVLHAFWIYMALSIPYKGVM